MTKAGQRLIAAAREAVTIARGDPIEAMSKLDKLPYGIRIMEKVIWLSGTIKTQVEADEVIQAINVLKVMLPKPPGDFNEL